MNRKEVLDAAAAAVLKDRQAVYGPPENSFADTAAMWAVILGVPVAAHQVALCLAALKIVRAKSSPDHADNWADLAGYAACGGELATNDEPELPGFECQHSPQWVGDRLICSRCGRDISAIFGKDDR